MYGQTLYGVTLFGADSQENSSPSKSVDLFQYLPYYYHGIREFQQIMNTEGEELGRLESSIDQLLDQFSINTATWGLSFWELELGLTVDPEKPIEWRRERIRAKLRGFGTTTKQMIKNAAAAFSGGEVDVIEYPAEHRFEIKFIGVKGIPPNMAGFVDMLEQIKPAHLAYSFKYTYTVWDTVKSLTWAQVSIKTWNELKVYDEGA
ncbi:YmfQ family protein [Anoxybacillus kestanbolensis]|uniref:YmfQ family protein n=1 Tax=Anoxybacillus kestanbolensis TaxID=227476 RepID=UPI00208DCC0A|nr:YmfQ family protein [Anoxybacillus kestanbolensis]MCL9971094.1 YmfQ family protein [Anoxybacillus kestanbolensis]